jgi:hypothetical protein
MNGSKQVFDLESFFVDKSCQQYSGSKDAVNFKLWSYIREQKRSREDCRQFMQKIGVSRNTSQRTSSAINWLRNHGFIKTTRDVLRKELKDVPDRPMRHIRSTPIPRLENGDIDAVCFKEAIRARQGSVVIGPSSMEPKEFVESYVKNNPQHKEGQILVAARSSGRARWDQVREAIHKDFKNLCDCRV